MDVEKIRRALELAQDFHQHDSKMHAVIAEAIAELPPSPRQSTACPSCGGIDRHSSGCPLLRQALGVRGG